MKCVDFGKLLLDSNDLDPVYVTLWEAGLPPMRQRKWLLAYWCFYDMGTASWMVDQPNYWIAMNKAASSKEYPRGKERRHFRGKNATDSVEYLRYWGVEELFEPFVNGRCKTAHEVMKIVNNWVGFGPWIAFKVADMVERLQISNTPFTTKDIFLYDVPSKGAEILASRCKKKFSNSTDCDQWAVTYLVNKLSEYMAPPTYDREFGAQEAETVLCKWKGYLKGTYHVGEDIQACKKSLRRFKTKTSKRLLKAANRSLTYP